MKTMPMSGTNEPRKTMTSENVKELLRAMENELDSMKDNALTEAWRTAQQRCPPHLIDDEHKLLFLRCEHFDVELACLRLLRYWSMRLQLFGEDKAFQRITLDKTLREDMVAIEIGEIQLTGTYDDFGRGICFDDGSKFPASSHFGNKYLQRRAMVRTQWYMLECALEDERVCQNGLTSVVEARKFSLKEFDAEQTRLMCNVLKCVPIRIEAIHICHPPWFIRILMPLLIRPKHFQNLVLAPTYYHASRSREGILRSLEKQGIPRASVPTELGGMTDVKYNEWLERRRELEAKRCEEDERLGAMASSSAPPTAEQTTQETAEVSPVEDPKGSSSATAAKEAKNHDATAVTRETATTTTTGNNKMSKTKKRNKPEPTIQGKGEAKEESSSSTLVTESSYSRTESRQSQSNEKQDEIVLVW